MKHPIFDTKQLADMLLQAGQERFFEERMWERATGKTTAAILKALLTATENPHKWVLVDSAGDTGKVMRRDALFNATAELARPLKYTQVWQGNLRTVPQEHIHGNWPAHVLSAAHVWVRFGSDK